MRNPHRTSCIYENITVALVFVFLRIQIKKNTCIINNNIILHICISKACIYCMVL